MLWLDIKTNDGFKILFVLFYKNENKIIKNKIWFYILLFYLFLQLEATPLEAARGTYWGMKGCGPGHPFQILEIKINFLRGSFLLGAFLFGGWTFPGPMRGFTLTSVQRLARSSLLLFTLYCITGLAIQKLC